MKSPQTCKPPGSGLWTVNNQICWIFLILTEFPARWTTLQKKMMAIATFWERFQFGLKREEIQAGFQVVRFADTGGITFAGRVCRSTMRLILYVDQPSVRPGKIATCPAPLKPN
jgi:hypothetical protein